VEEGYEIEGGWGRDEAVGLLRRFYVQENGRGTSFFLSFGEIQRYIDIFSLAPIPRKKEGRAARLAAMMEKDGDAGADGAPDNEAVQQQDEAVGEAADDVNAPVDSVPARAAHLA
jgi:hypothetical protein